MATIVHKVPQMNQATSVWNKKLNLIATETLS